MNETLRCDGCVEDKRIICDWAFSLRARSMARQTTLLALRGSGDQHNPSDPFEKNLEAIGCTLALSQVDARLKAEIEQKTWRYPHPAERESI